MSLNQTGNLAHFENRLKKKIHKKLVPLQQQKQQQQETQLENIKN